VSEVMVSEHTKHNLILFDLLRAGFKNDFTLINHVIVYFLAQFKTTNLYREKK